MLFFSISSGLSDLVLCMALNQRSANQAADPALHVHVREVTALRIQRASCGAVLLPWSCMCGIRMCMCSRKAVDPQSACDSVHGVVDGCTRMEGRMLGQNHTNQCDESAAPRQVCIRCQQVQAVLVHMSCCCGRTGKVDMKLARQAA